jgi:hypothetical protein
VIGGRHDRPNRPRRVGTDRPATTPRQGDEGASCTHHPRTRGSGSGGGHLPAEPARRPDLAAPGRPDGPARPPALGPGPARGRCLHHALPGPAESDRPPHGDRHSGRRRAHHRPRPPRGRHRPGARRADSRLAGPRQVHALPDASSNATTGARAASVASSYHMSYHATMARGGSNLCTRLRTVGDLLRLIQCPVQAA